jgi:hypothetical protein
MMHLNDDTLLHSRRHVVAKKTIADNSVYRSFMVIIVLPLVASMLPEIIFREWLGAYPVWLAFVRLIILFIAGSVFQYQKQEQISKYIFALEVIVIFEMITRIIFLSKVWQDTFDSTSFVGNFGGSIVLRAISALAVVVTLIILFKSPRAVYLTKGDLSTKADAIKWLGIKNDSISWGKLAVISAVLISLGTVMLTVFTVTGSSTNMNTGNLLKYFPFVLLFALFNSLSEGILFRSAILGSLKDFLPKQQAIFVAALIFGIGHFYGAPSGILGVFMSGLLGWYMCRSMYETKGFAASWLIHFMQDAVIFSTILLFGQYT